MKSCPELRNLKPGHFLFFRVGAGFGKIAEELKMVSDVGRDVNGDVNSVSYGGSVYYSPCFLAEMESNRVIVSELARSSGKDLTVFFGELKASNPEKVYEVERIRIRCSRPARPAKLTFVED